MWREARGEMDMRRMRARKRVRGAGTRVVQMKWLRSLESWRAGGRKMGEKVEGGGWRRRMGVGGMRQMRL